jgi:hypothetical protein
MKRIMRLDAQGREEAMEEIRRINARRQEIEEESARRTGRPLSGPAVRMVALPLSEEQAAAMEAEAAAEKGTPPL